MKTVLLVFTLILSLFLHGQSNQERIQQIEQEIKAAIAKEEYQKAANLKKEKDIRLQIEEAVKKGEYERAADLKKQIENGGVVKNEKSEKKEVPKEELVVKKATKKKKKKVHKKDETYSMIKFESVKDESVQVDLPPARIMDGHWVYPIGTVNGIEISYMLEVDADMDFEGYSDTYYDIDLIFRNVTGKKIVYNNPLDIVGEVKFTGEEVEIYLNDDKVIEKLGGKCPFLAEWLDHEDGKYVMYPDEDYVGFYTINQDSEGWLELMWLRRLKPLWVKSRIPHKYFDDNFSNDLRFYPDYKLTKKDNTVTSDGFVEKKIKLPSKKIECTPIRKDIKLKEPLETNGLYSVLFENENIKIEYKIDQSKPKFKSNSGYFYYPITFRTTNTGSMKLMPWKFGEKTDVVAIVDFRNSSPVKVTTENIKAGIVKSPELLPGESREYETELKVIAYSGELYETGKFSKRKVVSNRKFIPNYIKIPHELLKEAGSNTSASSDGKTKIHFFLKRGDQGDLTSGALDDKMYLSLYNKDTYRIYLSPSENDFVATKTGAHYVFELDRSGDIQMFISRNKKAKLKHFMKVKGGKSVIGLKYYPINLPKGNEVFILYSYGKGYRIVDKEKYKEFLTTSNFDHQPQVIKR